MTIIEMRKKRSETWKKAKNFLDTHRNASGILSAEDTATYERMEQEIVDLGHEIERQERLESIGPLLIVIGTLIGGIGSAMVNFKKLHGFNKGFPSVMTKLSGVFSKVGSAIGGISAPVLIVIAVIAVLVAAFKHLWDTNEGFRNKMIAIWDGIVAKIQSFVAAVKEKFSALGIDFNTVVECLKGIWDAFCNFLAPIFEGAFQLISDALSAVLDVIVGILDVFIGIFTGNWEQVWEGIKTIFTSLWDFIVNTLKNVLNTLKNAADSILQEWGTSWDEFWTMIKDFYVGIWNNIVDFFTGIIQAISDKILEIWNAITGFFTGIWNTITGVMKIRYLPQYRKSGTQYTPSSSRC